MVNKISETTRTKIKNKSAYGLPNRPGEMGISSEVVKKAFYEPIMVGENSVVGEINRVVEETNNELNSKVGVSSVVDNLTSADTDKPLSANQGKILNDNAVSKIDKSDITDNLTSTDTDKPLSANQGYALKTIINGLTDNVNDLSDSVSKKTSVSVNGSAVSNLAFISNPQTQLSNLSSSLANKCPNMIGFATSKYIKIPLGSYFILLQWGNVSDVSTGGTAVNLPSSYYNSSSFTVFVACTDYPGSGKVVNSSSSSFVLTASTGYAHVFNWFTIGYCH